jgi:hypothetical protein
MAKMKQLGVFVIALLVVLAGFAVVDISSMGIAMQSESDAIARETSNKWLEENKSMVVRGLQSALFGTPVWIRSMPEGSYVQGDIETVDGQSHLRQTAFEISHEKIVGKLVVLVDLRTSHVAGVEASIIAADLVGIAPVTDPDDTSDEALFSGDALTFGRIYFYLTGFSSLIWQMVLVGVLFGVIRGALGRYLGVPGVGASVIISAALAIGLIAFLADFEPAYMVGSAALVVFCTAWWVTSHEARESLANTTG